MRRKLMALTFSGPGLCVLIIILFVVVVYHKFPTVLNLPHSKYSVGSPHQSSSSHHTIVHSTQYEYHTGNTQNTRGITFAILDFRPYCSSSPAQTPSSTASTNLSLSLCTTFAPLSSSLHRIDSCYSWIIFSEFYSSINFIFVTLLLYAAVSLVLSQHCQWRLKKDNVPWWTILWLPYQNITHVSFVRIKFMKYIYQCPEVLL